MSMGVAFATRRFPRGRPLEFMPIARARVCFIASAHPSPFEPRIWHREACTLAGAGYDVTYIVQHPLTEVVENIRILGLPTPRNRLVRMTWLTWREYTARRAGSEAGASAG